MKKQCEYKRPGMDLALLFDYKKFFPINHQEFHDDRGLFSELTRSFSEGQI